MRIGRASLPHWIPPAKTAAVDALRHVSAGARLIRADPGLYARLVVVYSLPSAIAAIFALLTPDRIPGRDLLLGLLDFPTISFAPIVGMVAVIATSYGHRPSLLQISRLSIPWLPRYLWTNAHTSVIFWVPMLALTEGREWAAAILSGTAANLATWGAWGIIALTAVYLHSRLLLAPYLAIHRDLPATVATWMSWQLSGRRTLTTMITFLLSAAPIAVPLGALLLGLFLVAAPDDAIGHAFLVVLPHLIWVGIQLTRPLVIASAFHLYRDLWIVDQQARAGAPITPPRLVAVIAALTRWVPRLGRRPLQPEAL